MQIWDQQICLAFENPCTFPVCYYFLSSTRDLRGLEIRRQRFLRSTKAASHHVYEGGKDIMV